MIKKYLSDLINKENKFFSFLRFGIIGVINTIHYYIWYLLLLYIKLPYAISHTIAFTLSMIGSYFLNCYFTFKIKPTLKKFIKFPLTTLTNYIISTFSLILLVDYFHISSSIAALLASILPIPITFIVTHRVLKKSDANLIVKTKILNFPLILKNLFAIIFLMFFSICCHYYVLKSGNLFGKYGTDCTLQFMYFVPFIQKAFLSGQQFWSWNYGLGGDVFGQFSYYYTTSPFFYLMLLIRKLGIGSWTLEDTMKWKMIFSILKQSLSMISLFYLLKYEKKRTYTSLIGAMIYGGCIHFIWFSLYFDFMSDAYIWIPLTILGWRIYKKTNNWIFFIISAAITIANSFYFGFISFVFYIIFIVVFIDIKGKNFIEKIGAFFSYILKYALFAVMALGLSAIAFIPSVLAFLITDRFSITVNVPAFYSNSYILGLPEKLFFYSGTLGFPMIIIIIFGLPWKKLHVTTKKKTIIAGILFIMYLIPYSGSFFNGLSYSSDRWFYLLIFSIAYAVPDWLEENDRLRNVSFYFFINITILMFFFFYTKGLRGFNYTLNNIKSPMLINRLIFTSGLISLLALTLKKYNSIHIIKEFLNYIVVLCVGISLVCNTTSYLSIIPPDMTRQLLQEYFVDGKEDKEIFSNLTPSHSEFYRTLTNSKIENASLNYSYYGTSAYNSMIDGNLHKWLKVDYDILNPYVCPSRYENFDDRLFLETTFGVKYLVRDKTDSYIPTYAYVLKKQTNKYNLYENKYNVGFDLWYSNTINTDKYNKMNFAEKDAMLLQTAMVEQNIPGLSSSTLNNVTTELAIEWSKATTKNLQYKDGNLIAGKDATISIPIRNTQKSNKGEILFSLNIKPVNRQMINLTVNGKQTIKMEEAYAYAYPLNTFTFRLDGNTDVIKIDISEGKYTLSNVHTWFNSFKYYENWINERNKYNLQNIYINGGNIKATIKNDEKGIIALNIPFSKGWSAKVDGKKQELIAVNGVLTGLILEPGFHKIELTYITPGLISGAFISTIFCIGIAVFYILKRVRTKPNPK